MPSLITIQKHHIYHMPLVQQQGIYEGQSGARCTGDRQRPIFQHRCSGARVPSDYYANVNEGTTVITSVFVALTSEQSHKLARAFGVGAVELGNHHRAAA